MGLRQITEDLEYLDQCMCRLWMVTMECRVEDTSSFGAAECCKVREHGLTEENVYS